MRCKKSDNEVVVSAVVASSYVRRLVEHETRGSGDTEEAMRRLESRFGIPFWSLVHLRRGAAKTIDADLFARVRGAYLAHCEATITRLQHEIAVEKTIGAHDADLEALEAAARDLALQIQAKKAARVAKKGQAA